MVEVYKLENLTFKYQATKTIPKRSHVGVVGSGDLEILLEPTEENVTRILVRTGSEGFEGIWKAVMDQFFTLNAISANVMINDFGATPGVVNLRLHQALEVSLDDNNY